MIWGTVEELHRVDFEMLQCEAEVDEQAFRFAESKPQLPHPHAPASEVCAPPVVRQDHFRFAETKRDLGEPTKRCINPLCGGEGKGQSCSVCGEPLLENCSLSQGWCEDVQRRFLPPVV